MTTEEENEVLKYLINALLARSASGVLIITKEEVKATFANRFKYELDPNGAIMVEAVE